MKRGRGIIADSMREIQTVTMYLAMLGDYHQI